MNGDFESWRARPLPLLLWHRGASWHTLTTADNAGGLSAINGGGRDIAAGRKRPCSSNWLLPLPANGHARHHARSGSSQDRFKTAYGVWWRCNRYRCQRWSMALHGSMAITARMLSWLTRKAACQAICQIYQSEPNINNCCGVAVWWALQVSERVKPHGQQKTYCGFNKAENEPRESHLVLSGKLSPIMCPQALILIVLFAFKRPPEWLSDRWLDATKLLLSGANKTRQINKCPLSVHAQESWGRLEIGKRKKSKHVANLVLTRRRWDGCMEGGMNAINHSTGKRGKVGGMAILSILAWEGNGGSPLLMQRWRHEMKKFGG